MANQSNEVQLRYAKDSVVWYYQKKREFENAKAVFEEHKAKFEKDMEKYYNLLMNEDGEVIINVKDVLYNIAKIKISKVSRVELIFNVAGIKSLLSKEDRKAVIRKTYSITDWPGLFNLLKSHGVDFKEFMKYASVTEYVIPEQLDRIVDLGKVKEDDVRKYITTKKSKPYYRLSDK